MKELNFDSGLVTYSLNGKCEVSFNPTDSNFVERLFKTFDDLDKKQEVYRADVEKASDSREVFEVARKCDAEMRAMVDEAMGTPVCDALFGDMNVYAMADGLPVWANLMLAIMDEIDTSFAKQKKLTDPRVAKYTSKYHK